jgi:hypothetical protein
MHEDTKVCGSEVMVSRLKSDIQARPSLLIRMLALRPREFARDQVTGGKSTYPFEIPMYNPLVVHIHQPVSTASKLR